MKFELFVAVLAAVAFDCAGAKPGKLWRILHQYISSSLWNFWTTFPVYSFLAISGTILNLGDYYDDYYDIEYNDTTDISGKHNLNKFFQNISSICI